jgi:steroid delta-isomerase-like uncharacterized protein
MESRTSTSNEQLVKKLIDAENSHNPEALLSLVTDDVVIEDVPINVVMKGKNGVKEGYSMFIAAAPDFKIEPKSWVANDHSFAVEFVLSGTQKGDLPGIPATGKKFSFRGCSFGALENGKLKSRRDYWDLIGLTKQLGVAG